VGFKIRYNFTILSENTSKSGGEEGIIVVGEDNGVGAQ
jgi:hypothetical protein